MGNALRDYLFQIIMRPGSNDAAMMICFELGLYSKLSLGTPERFCSKDFPIPISFIYGDRDWTRGVDLDFGKTVISINKFDSCKFHLVKDSDHNMHMDNPEAFANIIINDLLDQQLPVDIEPVFGSQIDLQEQFNQAEPEL